MPLGRRILKLALPSIATFSSQTLTGMLTLIIVGRLGASAIAIVGICNILMYNCWALFAGLNESINYLVSQNYGEKSMSAGNQRMQIALLLSLVLDVLWFVASLTLPREILTWVGANPSLIHAGTSYLRIRMFAFLFSMFTNVFYAYMRAVGDTKTPMLISMFTNSALIVLTYILTYGAFSFHGLGLDGAGWSMVITEGIGFTSSLFVYYVLYQRKFSTRVWQRIHWEPMRLIIWESAKLSVMELSMSLGMLVFTACITRLGTVAVAANEMALNILSLGFMPANGFSAAATIIVGQDVGRKRPLDAKRGGLYTVGFGLIFMALFSIFLWLFALRVAKIYTADAAVYTLAVSLIHIASFIQLFDGAGIIFSGGLRGSGDTTFLFRMSLILNWIVFIPLTIVLTTVFHLGQSGAWFSLCTLIVLICLSYGFRYLKMDWSMVASRSIHVQPAVLGMEEEKR
ncbi:MATE family efflux transporter [Alicyclobacillus fodiniaquatilis]|uniref:Probable multidrug resistance protein NorM n=1 Tax=Alicyclobacillus fodiniaquatilis TaxID=1661150 RepID=A0ABW4JJK5_9BACL